MSPLAAATFSVMRTFAGMKNSPSRSVFAPCTMRMLRSYSPSRNIWSYTHAPSGASILPTYTHGDHARTGDPNRFDHKVSPYSVATQSPQSYAYGTRRTMGWAAGWSGLGWRRCMVPRILLILASHHKALRRTGHFFGHHVFVDFLQLCKYRFLEVFTARRVAVQIYFNLHARRSGEKVRMVD